jgi:hypothetical protein
MTRFTDLTKPTPRRRALGAALAAIVLTAPIVACKSPAPAPASGATSPAQTGPRRAVTVDGMGYHPATVSVPAGQPVTLVFTRTSDDGCGQQLVFPTLGIRRDLPLDQPVEVTVTPERGELRFTCGMDMYRGSVLAQ